MCRRSLPRICCRAGMIPAMASEASTDVLRSSRNARRAAVASTASICDKQVEKHRHRGPTGSPKEQEQKNGPSDQSQKQMGVQTPASPPQPANQPKTLTGPSRRNPHLVCPSQPLIRTTHPSTEAPKRAESSPHTAAHRTPGPHAHSVLENKYTHIWAH